MATNVSRRGVLHGAVALGTIGHGKPLTQTHKILQSRSRKILQR